MKKNEIKYQSGRDSIIDFLECLSSEEVQKSNWYPNEFGEYDGTFDMAVHYFFDDTTLANDPEANVGWSLKSKEEANSLKILTNTIEILLNKYGDLPGWQYLDKREWQHIVASASAALAIIQKND